MIGKVFPTAAILIALIGLMLIPVAGAGTQVSDVRLDLSGEQALGTLRTGTYSATLNDPLARTWNYKIYIMADNTTGATPLKDSPLNGTFTPDNKTISFDITAQQRQGELEIHINCTSGAYYFEKVQKIIVVNPISLKAKVTNQSPVEIKNATVQFYVDGTHIDTQTINSIGANQSVDVESEWISLHKEPGWHDSRIVVDINGDGVIDTNSGDIIIDNRFYIEGESSWLTIAIILVGLLALVIGFGYISKRKM